jgi:eukaryotic-like serine/threonine-protein kinase
MAPPLDNLGSYELLRPLGAGGMAETFVAIRRGPAGFEQRVCLKRILPGCAADPLFVELFLDEARLLARLQCRNIVHVYDFGETNGTYYMSLELVDGVDLEALLRALHARGVRMPPSVALYVVGELLSALSYAHTLEIDGEAQHIVHRDISPSNILISKNGEVKLTDFGIAKARGRSHRTQTGHTKGKVAYMSPEQMRAEPLDGRSDLFAVGVVLFELLTGTHPFDANTDFALQLNIMQGKRPPLHELLPDAPEPIARLVDALLATDAAQRPASAADAMALIPPIEAPFVLQRELQRLVALREGPSDRPSEAVSLPHASPSARPPFGASSDAATPRAPMTAPAGEPAQLASARQTTATQARVSRFRPALWVALTLVVLALGYAVGRQRSSHADTVDPAAGKAERAAGAPLPAAPAALPGPSSAAERAPEAAAPVGREPPAVAPSASSTALALPPPLPEREGTRERSRAERHKGKKSERASLPVAEADDARPGEGEASSFVSATRPPATEGAAHAPREATTPSAARAPSDARVIIQAPRPDDNGRPAPERKAYVTPSGRVVLPAPPLP